MTLGQEKGTFVGTDIALCNMAAAKPDAPKGYHLVLYRTQEYNWHHQKDFFLVKSSTCDRRDRSSGRPRIAVIAR